jgi:hypothetical protein
MANLQGFKKSANTTPYNQAGKSVNQYMNTMNTQITTPQLKGLGSNTNPGSKLPSKEGTIPQPAAAKSSILGSIAGAVPQIAEGIMDAAGLERASSGSTKGVMDSIGDSIKDIPIIGTLGNILFKGIGLLDEYGGKKTKKNPFDANYNTGGYALKLNPNAGKKTSFFNMGRAKDINNTTNRDIRDNSLAGNAAFKNTQNQLTATNIHGDISTRTQQQFAGGINTNILSAKKGNKIKPIELGNIANKAKRKVRKVQEGTPTDDLQKMQNGSIIKMPTYETLAMNGGQKLASSSLVKQTVQQTVPPPRPVQKPVIASATPVQPTRSYTYRPVVRKKVMNNIGITTGIENTPIQRVNDSFRMPPLQPKVAGIIPFRPLPQRT